MPYQVERRSGSRPWKIIKSDTGEIVGSSISKEEAESSIRVRSMTSGLLEEVDLPCRLIYESIGGGEKDRETVLGMIEKLTKGETLPPITVRSHPSLEGRYLVTDGNHRVRAHKMLGLPTIRAVRHKNHAVSI